MRPGGPVILTIDMGTTVTKVSLWGPDGMVAHCGIPLVTARPGPDRAEQDPSSWWVSLVDGCDRLRAGAGDRFGAVEVVGCTGARQSLVMVGADVGASHRDGARRIKPWHRVDRQAAKVCNELLVGRFVNQIPGWRSAS